MFGKQTFAGPHRNNGTHKGMLTLCLPTPCLPTLVYIMMCSPGVVVLLLEQFLSLNSFCAVVGGKVNVSIWVFWALGVLSSCIRVAHLGVACPGPLWLQCKRDFFIEEKSTSGKLQRLIYPIVHWATSTQEWEHVSGCSHRRMCLELWWVEGTTHIPPYQLGRGDTLISTLGRPAPGKLWMVSPQGWFIVMPFVPPKFWLLFPSFLPY